MKIIVLHDKYSDEPIVIKVDAITAIQKMIDREGDSKEEYSGVHTANTLFYVRERMEAVMLKIKNAERKAKWIESQERSDKT